MLSLPHHRNGARVLYPTHPHLPGDVFAAGSFNSVRICAAGGWLLATLPCDGATDAALAAAARAAAASAAVTSTTRGGAPGSGGSGGGGAAHRRKPSGGGVDDGDDDGSSRPPAAGAGGDDGCDVPSWGTVDARRAPLASAAALGAVGGAAPSSLFDATGVGSVTALSWSDDGHRIAAGCSRGAVVLASVLGRCVSGSGGVTAAIANSRHVTVTVAADAAPSAGGAVDALPTSTPASTVERPEELVYREVVTAVAVGYGHVVVATTAQIHFYRVGEGPKGSHYDEPPLPCACEYRAAPHPTTQRASRLPA